jgi:hypothetical protein
MDRLDVDDPLVAHQSFEAAHPDRSAPRAGVRPKIGGYRLGMLAGMMRLQVEGGLCANAAAEARLASDISTFLRAFDPICDLLVGAFVGETLVGAIAVDGRLHGAGIAAIRWFAVDRRLADRVVTGRCLLDHATQFCRERGFASVRLIQPAFDPEYELLFKELAFRRHEDLASTPNLPGVYPGMPVATLAL